MPEGSSTVEERLARLEIAEAARQLVVAYATACDAQDPDLLRPIFAADMALSSPGMSLAGIDDVLRFYREAWSSSSTARRHFITNTSADVSDADTATAMSYFLFVSSADAVPQIGWGTYQDTFERRDGTLVFTHKHIVVELDVDVRRGWATEFAAAFERSRSGTVTGRLADRVAVVTGGASGIGEATVRRFVDEGARVVIADVQRDRGTALATELGGAAVFVHTDVTREDAVAAAVETAVSRFGSLDVMFNNAGIMGALGPIGSLTLEDFNFTMDVNLVGAFFGMKHAARVMAPRGSGVILSTTSPAAVAGGLGPHVYSAAKAAIVGLTQSVAAELRPRGVRVNAIMPGATVTAMTADIVIGDPEAIGDAAEALGKTALTPRPGLPSDIAAAALYLASDDAEFVTGEVLRVDGGLTTAPGSSPFAAEQFASASLMREGGARGVPPRP